MQVTRSKSNYLASLRQEIDGCSRVDLATREGFVTEIGHHIELLAESLQACEPDDHTKEARAVSLMEPPRQLAESLGRAEHLARRTTPLHWRMVVLKNWMDFLQIHSRLAWAAIVCLCSVASIEILLALAPQSVQEFWTVPAMALSVFGLSWLVGRISTRSEFRAPTPSHILWAVFFAGGANLATFAAERVASIDIPTSVHAAHGAFALTIALFASVSLACIYFPGIQERMRFFKIAFTTVTVAYLLFAQAAVWLVGHNPRILFCIYVVFGIAALQSVRTYTSSIRTRPALSQDPG